MRLAFRLLLVDDNPDAIEQALKTLESHLDSKGFALDCKVAEDLSRKGLKNLARGNGRDFDLVVIDFNLGGQEGDGSEAVEDMRSQLQYTDIIFYSSDPNVNLWQELASREVAGVFIADRLRIDEFLIGIANTIIGKAIDLNHMRGIAMAEVAEMDVLMEETLHNIFDCDDEGFTKAARKTLEALLEGAENRLTELRPVVENGQVLALVGNSLAFSSSDKYKAIRRSAKVLKNPPTEALELLNNYDTDIIKNRNILAHAKEETDDKGQVSLRSSKRGERPILIDERWMTDFRGKLRSHRQALVVVCQALLAHLRAPT
jgi:CheY-like chemotaxis protein